MLDNIIKRKVRLKKLAMEIRSFLIKNIDDISDSISMSVSDISNFGFIISINKEKFTDMESSNNRIRFHYDMIIK